MISEADGLVDFLEKMELFQIISDRDKELVEEINNTKKDIEYKKVCIKF